MDPTTLEGLVFVVAAGRDAGAESASAAVADRIEALLPSGMRATRRALPGAVWGWVPPGTSRGDRLDHAAAGPAECVLRGDPAWMEPESPAPCTAASVLARWERDGRGAFRLLDNLWLAAVADSSAGDLWLATDPIGGIRLYSTRIGECAVLATSYPLVARLAASKDPDKDAIATFFHLGYFPGRSTALRAVEVHPFGTVARVRDGRVEVVERWSPDFAVDRSRPVDDVLDEAVAAFNASVREQTAGYSPAWLAMTAGLDSRSVLASLVRQKVSYRTYTHGFPGCWEGKRVDRIVRRHGIRHRFVPLDSGFSDRLRELALESFRATAGEISFIEKSHLVHVLSTIGGERGSEGSCLLLGGGAGLIKGTFYRLLREEPVWTAAGVDRYVTWNLARKLPDIFAPDVRCADPGLLRDFVVRSFDEVEGGTLFQKLDWFFLVRYRRWAGGVKSIYRRFFPVREPFVSRRLIECSYRWDPAIKAAKLPHFRILSDDYPPLQYDLTNKMSPALPLSLRTLPRFAPSAWWRTKQVLRGFSRRYLPRELFPLVDYVDYRAWIRTEGGLSLVDEFLKPGDMRSDFLYEEGKLEAWLRTQRDEGFPSFPMIDRALTLELFFRELGRP